MVPDLSRVSDMLTIAEAARRLRCSRRAIVGMMEGGILEGLRVPGARPKIAASSVEAVLASSRFGGPDGEGMREPSGLHRVDPSMA